MDSARVALRMQKLNNIGPDVTVMYRRTENEMPARRLEIQHAGEEGVKFEFLVSPLGFSGDDSGAVQSMESLRCKLGEPDSGGRRRPVAIEGSNFSVKCDQAVIAIGLKANQVLIQTLPDLKTDKYSDIIVDPETMKTSLEGVYAGGDVVGGEGTVIEAMGMAKKAARSIVEYLSKKYRIKMKGD
jgi:glutamate synthase (NADPH) small chain